MNRLISCFFPALLVLTVAACSGNPDAPGVSRRPAQFAAAHILIGYQGATRSGASRSKAQARALALAAEVLEQATAENADFAALARQYSEGPSSTRGGDLGAFREGQMVPPFEAAVKATRVGEVHDVVVETAFGFHIIKRTE